MVDRVYILYYSALKSGCSTFFVVDNNHPYPCFQCNFLVEIFLKQWRHTRIFLNEIFKKSHPKCTQRRRTFYARTPQTTMRLLAIDGFWGFINVFVHDVNDIFPAWKKPRQTLTDLQPLAKADLPSPGFNKSCRGLVVVRVATPIAKCMVEESRFLNLPKM